MMQRFEISTHGMSSADDSPFGLDIAEFPALYSVSLSVAELSLDAQQHLEKCLDTLAAIVASIRPPTPKKLFFKISSLLMLWHLMFMKDTQRLGKLDQLLHDHSSHLDVLLTIIFPLRMDRTQPWNSLCAAFEEYFPLLHQRGSLKIHSSVAGK